MKVTIKVIAERVGVSSNAVSLALRNHPSISRKTRDRILSVAQELGYQRNPVYGELMSQMRLKGYGSTTTLALFNANQNIHAFSEHSTLPEQVHGCRNLAKRLGYALDSFWMHEPNTDSARWIDILEARGIRGIIVAGMAKQNRLPTALLPLFERFPSVVTGIRMRDPALSFTCSDHYILALRAFERALDLGYKRPGLVITQTIENLHEHRLSAGYRCGQATLPKARQLRPLFPANVTYSNSQPFKDWMKRERPDVIFTFHTAVWKWLEDLGYSVPDDVGLIQLEWREKLSDWAGMNRHNNIIGEAAVEMLIGMIHRGETGIPEFPRATLIGPTWVDGQTVRSQL